jgi:hypothetical protein
MNGGTARERVFAAVALAAAMICNPDALQEVRIADAPIRFALGYRRKMHA